MKLQEVRGFGSSIVDWNLLLACDQVTQNFSERHDLLLSFNISKNKARSNKIPGR